MVKQSVIIPVYNVENYIEKCLASVLGQDYPELEVILVDDGSKDSSGEICERYAELDKRIKVIHQENGGLSAARNTGIEAATGEWVTFLDSDDYLANGFFERVDIYSSEKAVDMIAFKLVEVKEGAEPENKDTFRVDFYTSEEAYVKMANYDGILHTVCGKAYRREALEYTKFEEGRLAEDLQFSYKILAQLRRVCVIDITGYYYVIHGGSIMTTGSFQLFKDAYKGETEVREYASKLFPGQTKVRETRYLTQSMKYDCLIRKHWRKDPQAKPLLKEIERDLRKVQGQNIRFGILLVYIVFAYSKTLATLLITRGR